MSPPEDQHQVIVHDAAAHRKLDRILEWIEGDAMAGKPGTAETIRHHETTLADHEARLIKHTEQIDALEDAGGERAKSTLRTLIEKVLTVLSMVISSTIGGAIAAHFFRK